MKTQTPLIISVNFMLFMVISPVWAVTKHVPSEYGTIQTAINDCNDGDTVLVASGTYTGEGNRDIDFNGKAITLKSENGEETCIIDCQASEQDLHRGFYFHNREGNDSVLDGFTITNGCAYGGGAIYCRSYSSPTIKNCTLRQNVAATTLHNVRMPTITDGGAIACYDSNSIIVNCTFLNNFASGAGGAAYFGGSYPRTRSNVVFQNCIFSQNEALGGGAVGFDYSDVTFRNCVISGNIAQSDSYPNSNYGGGGIFCFSGSVSIFNSTIIGNRTTSSKGGGGIYVTSGKILINSSLMLNDMAVQGREIGLLIPSSVLLDVCYSNIQGGIEELQPDSSLGWGVGNIDVDPSFAYPGYWVHADDPNIIVEQYDPNNPNIVWLEGDYHLRSQAGRWDPNSQTWVQDDVTSPCIDTGDPNSPIMHEPFPNGGYVNMGAYGGTSEASKSYFGGPVCETIIAGDINGDCRVDSADLEILMLHWLEVY